MIWLLSVGMALADAQGSYAAGIEALRSGDYAAATEALHAALDEGGHDPAVYHALGNAYYRQDQLGYAIAAWRRGLVLAPRDGDIAGNLDRARRQTTDRLDAPDLTTPFFWQRSLSVRESGLVASVLTALALWLLVVHRMLLQRRGRGVGPTVRWVGWLSLGFGLLSGVSTVLVLQVPPHAVITAGEVTAASALGADGVALFELHEGAEVQVVEESADHALIELPDGRKGWVPAASLVSADPDAALSPAN